MMILNFHNLIHYYEGGDIMKTIFKWLYVNKNPCSGMLALILFLVDNIFKLSEKMCLPSGWYYTIVAFLFVIIGFTINGKGIQGLKMIDEMIENNQHNSE